MAGELSQLHSAIFATSWRSRAIEDQLSKDNYLGIAAQCIKKRDLVGYIYIQRVAEIAEIMSFGVKSEYRNLGVGEKLVHRGLIELVQLNIEELFLEVAESNKIAVDLYSKFGFEVVGNRKKYYRIEGASRNNMMEDALVMRKKLDDPRTGW